MASGVKKTTEEFIRQANIVHKNRYDYSKTIYERNNKNVCIICPDHGEFLKEANSHLQGKGCQKCSKINSIKKQTDSLTDVLEKFKKIHKDVYDYSLVEYINSSTKVKIICKIHGIFEQAPSEHIVGKGCNKCAIAGRTLTLDVFINKANEVHNNKFDYSKAIYVNNKSKIEIICPEHGKFIQTAASHLNGSTCPKCALKRVTSTTEDFIQKSNLIHGNKYDYSKVDYINSSTKVIITCIEHGDFETTPSNHLNGLNCKLCNYKSYTLSIEDFIQKSNLVHDNFYNYSKVEYINSKTKVIIICPEHGEFLQTPNEHLQGSGCPKCKLKSQAKLFNRISNSFIDEIIEWEASPSWLENQRFDIFIPKYNIAIEYNGIQHYEIKKNLFGGEEGFIKTQERDELKREKCRLNNCALFEVKYDYDDYDYEDLVTNIKTIIKN